LIGVGNFSSEEVIRRNYQKSWSDEWLRQVTQTTCSEELTEKHRLWLVKTRHRLLLIGVGNFSSEEVIRRNYQKRWSDELLRQVAQKNFPKNTGNAW